MYCATEVTIYIDDHKYKMNFKFILQWTAVYYTAVIIIMTVLIWLCIWSFDIVITKLDISLKPMKAFML